MALSPITSVLNHFSDSVVVGILAGGVGYLCARIVRYIDPKVGFVCGVTAGMILGLFWGEGSYASSKVVGLAALFFVPYQVCQRLELPTTLRTAAILSVMSTILVMAIALLANKVVNKERM
jgi:hypothetical protein